MEGVCKDMKLVCVENAALSEDQGQEVVEIPSSARERSELLTSMFDESRAEACLPISISFRPLHDWIEDRVSYMDVGHILEIVKVAAFLRDVCGTDRWADAFWKCVDDSGLSHLSAESLLRESSKDIAHAVFLRHPMAIDPRRSMADKLVDPGVPVEAHLGVCKHSLVCTESCATLEVGADWAQAAYRRLLDTRPALDFYVQGLRVWIGRRSPMTDHAYAAFASIRTLRSLDLRLLGAHVRVPQCFGPLTGIEHLAIHDSSGACLEDACTCTFVINMPRLVHVELVNACVGESHVAALADWLAAQAALERLDLAGSFFEGGVAPILTRLTGLTHLGVDRVRHRCFTPSDLDGLPKLTSLSVAGLWRMPDWSALSRLSQLQKLSFADCDFGPRDAGTVYTLGKLVHLTQLDLSGNRLSPPALTSHLQSMVDNACTKLEYLDISEQIPGPAWWMFGSVGACVLEPNDHWEALARVVTRFPRLRTLCMGRIGYGPSPLEAMQHLLGLKGNIEIR